jgi:CDP-diacylglycerol--glycerol-3-phosphate 3-phosphatidyltransferase
LTLANKVTLARIALIPFCLAFMLTGFYGLAAVVFVVLSFSDAIDGYIARKYNQVSDLGKQLDPLADKLLVMNVLVVLAALGKAGVLPVMLILTREFVITGIRAKKAFATSQIAKWKTIVQMLAVFMCILSLPWSNLVLWLAVVLAYVSGGAYLWQSQFLQQLKSS